MVKPIKTTKVTHKHVFSMQLCRLCGVKKVCGTNLCSPESMHSGLLSKINIHLTKQIIHITAEDVLSKYICANCELTVTNFVKFSEIVKTAQRNLEKEKFISNPKKPNISSKTASNSRKSLQSILPAAIESIDIGTSFQEDSSPSSADEDLDVATVTVGPNGIFVCLKCQKHLDTVEQTTWHMRTHCTGTVVCSCRVCGKQGKLKQFVTNKSGKPTIFCSGGCFLGTQNKKNKAILSPTDGHACGVCPKVFRSQAHKSRHAVIHSGDKPFLCHICGAGFSQIESLKVHGRSHEQADPHTCPQCGQKFRFKVALRSHVLSHHGTADSKHVCDRCGKQFATAYKLERHYRQHTGDKPFQCVRCAKLFSQSGNLHKHMRKIHKEEAAKEAVPAASVEPVPPRLTELQNAVKCIQPTSFLVTIPEEDSVPCNSNTVISSPAPHFVSFNQDPGKGRRTAYRTVPPLNTIQNTKPNQRKSLGKLFASFEDGGVLSTDRSSEYINEVTLTLDGVTLPKFSSLQSSGPTSGHVHSAI